MTSFNKDVSFIPGSCHCHGLLTGLTKFLPVKFDSKIIIKHKVTGGRIYIFIYLTVSVLRAHTHSYEIFQRTAQNDPIVASEATSIAIKHFYLPKMGNEL